MFVINFVESSWYVFGRTAVKLVCRKLHGDHAHEVVEILEDPTVPAEELFSTSGFDSQQDMLR